MNNKKTTKRSIWNALVLACLIAAPWGWASEQDWVATWVAPASTLRPAPGSEKPEDRYQNQTLRLVLHTSAGGSQLRIKVANTHGNEMLKVQEANIAIQSSDGGIVKGSVKALTFGGQSSLVLPRGGVAISDGIDFNVPPMSNLAISLYFKDQTPYITRHGNANQSSWLAEGNQADAVQLKGAKTIASWDFVSAVEIIPNEDVSVIAAVGDSITDGYLSTVSANNRWPNYFARRLANGITSQQFSVVNGGISGNRVLREASPRFGENLLARLERDVFSIPGLTHMVLLEGINDIGMGFRTPDEKVTAEELIAAYRLVIGRAHAESVKIIGATLLPYKGAAYFSEDGEKTRLKVNKWIRESGEYDGVIDFEKAVQDPAMPSRILPAFTQDNLHPNDAGYEAMANIIDLNLFTD